MRSRRNSSEIGAKRFYWGFRLLQAACRKSRSSSLLVKLLMCSFVQVSDEGVKVFSLALQPDKVATAIQVAANEQVIFMRTLLSSE